MSCHTDQIIALKKHQKNAHQTPDESTEGLQLKTNIGDFTANIWYLRSPEQIRVDIISRESWLWCKYMLVTQIRLYTTASSLAQLSK